MNILPSYTARLLPRMLRYHVTSPYIVFWRTIEVAVMVDLAARQGLDLQAHVDLDVGCGNGVLGHALIRDIGIGFDLGAEGVAWARRHKPAYRALLRASATDMPLRSASQQFVFSNSVIEHIPNDMAAFDELARVVAPGGFLLLSTVSEQFPMLMLGHQPNPAERAAIDQSYAHHHYYSAETLRRILSDRGLELCEYAYYIDAAQARWCYQLRQWEQRHRRGGLWRRANQLRRAPIGLALVAWMRRRYAPYQAGVGLAIIARRPA
ncbi:MAG TPA: class I SAM-dependent methyltransferase [Kouleothrix sp.]|uniref:class I SAM-dependent methyltransferase n=1 Tax=Kouleothrix sp. TaxID=2779161 RepID=UPI002C448940|nr:class I SAM-dependent methyltransferase [Kouleothrix sp.]